MKTQRANRTRSGDQRNIAGGRLSHRTLTPLAACIRRASLPAGVLLTLPFQAALAAPQGGQVVGGQGSISQAGTTTTINQQSQNLAVDWQSFNVKSNELVKFNQPSAKAAALNRIFDQNPSQIYGSIQANGTVLLLNPNGVIFQPGSHVNVGSLVAAGMQMSVGDFMSGNYKLENLSDSAGGAVINRGLIEAATGGSVTLAGKSVSNEGLILANAGRVNLAAGSKITLDFDGDGLIRFTVDEGVLKNAAGTNAAVSNTGKIVADGGQVLLTGKAAENVFSQVVNNQGVIKAARVDNQGGVVKLVGLGPNSSVVNTGTINVVGQGAGSSGGTVALTATNVTQNGTIDASAAAGGDGGQIKLQAADTTVLGGDSVTIARSDSGGKGGTVQALGDHVGLFDNSVVDVSGALGGGTALIGGDRHGANPDVQNASRTYVGPNASIIANATDSGDGGNVVVWSNEVTRFYGSLSARGGAQSGNGGSAEISSAGNLYFDGSVDLFAPNGTGGNLLFDPTNITFSTSADSNTTGFTPTTDQTEAFSDDSGKTSNFLVDGTGTLSGVSAGSTITFQATNDITVSNAFVLSTATTQNNVSIVMQAGNNINIDAALTADGTGSISLTANDPGGTQSGTGAINIASTGSITSASGNVSLTVDGGSGSIVVGGAITTGTGNVSFSTNSGTGTLQLGANVQTDGGTIDATSVAGGTSLTAAVTLDTALTSGQNAGAVNLLAVDGAQALIIDTTGTGGGTAAGITLGTVGGTTPLASLTLKGSTAGLQAVTTSGAQDYSGVTTTTLNGTLTVNTAGAGVKAGNVSLAAGGGAITLTGSNAANDVTLGTVDGAQALNITAGGGDIVLGAVGGTTPLTTVTLSGNTASLQAVTSSGAQDYSGVTTTTLNGTLTVNTAGAGVKAGNVSLAAGGGTITLTGSNAANDVTLGTVDGAQALAITAGGGDVSLGMTGGSTALSSATISAGTVALNNVTTSGLQSYTGTTTLSGTTYKSSTSGAITFNSAVTLNAGSTVNLTTAGSSGDNIAFGSTIDGAAAGQQINFTAGTGGNVTVTGNIGSSQALQLVQVTSAATATFAGIKVATSSVAGHESDVVLSIAADEINFTGGNGSVVGNGTGDVTNNSTAANALANPGNSRGHVILQPLTLSEPVNFNGSGDNAGVLDLTSSDFGALADNFVLIDVGATGGGNITVKSNAKAIDPMRFNSSLVQGNGSGLGTITAKSGTDGAIYQSATGTLVLTQDLIYDGTTVVASNFDFSNTDVLVGADSVNTTTGILIDSKGYPIIFGKNLASTDTGGTSDQNPLEINAGTGGNVTFTGNVGVAFGGQGGALGDVVIDNANNVAINSPQFTAGSFTITKAASVSVGPTAFTVTGSTDDLTNTTVGVFTPTTAGFSWSSITGGVTLNGDVSVDTTATNAPVSLSGVTVDGAHGLIITAGTGAVNLGNLGQSTALTNVSATGSTIALQSVRTTGSQTYTGASTIGGGATLRVDSDNNSAETLSFGGTVTAGAGAQFAGGTDGNDTLASTVATNTWTVSSLNSGTLNGVPFTNFASLTGGGATDSFSFTGTGSLGGTLDGGAGTTNSINWLGLSTSRAVTLTGLGASTGFDGTDPSIGGGFKNITSITGSSSAADSLTGLNAASTWALSGPGTETYTSTNTLAFSSFETLNGGSSGDTFNISAPHTGSVAGGGGADAFVFTGTGKISGSVNGGAGADTLDYSGYGSALTVSISGPGTIDGFQGTEPNTITGGYDNIDGVKASPGSTFVAPNTTNTWDITASNTFTLNGSAVPFTGFTNLTGGTSTDTFALNGGTMTGLVSGGGGTDTLVGDNTANTWTITSANAGTVSGANGTQKFAGIANLTGNGLADTFTFQAGGSLSGILDGAGGTDSASYAAVAAPLALTVGANVLNMESVTGNASRSDQILVGDTSTANTWTITGPNDGTVGSVTFTDFNTIRSGGAGDTFNVPVAYAGNVQIQGNATWNYTPGAQLGSSISSVGGPVGVSLTVPTTAGADVTVSSSDLRFPVPTNMTGFKGRLVIGGTLADPGVADVMTTQVTAINANSLTVADNSLQTGGDIVLLAGDINLNSGSLISAGGAGGVGTATLFAGNLGSTTANGDISGPTSGTATIEGGNVNLIANDNIINPANIAVDTTFNGKLLVAVNASQLQPDFSNVNNAFSGGQFDATQLANFVGNFGANLQSFEINLTNPGSLLVQQALLGFVDVSVFNQELTLFGVIGNGIALTLDQCEEADGCAPSVNEAQLKQLISDLQARIDELEKRKAAGKISAEEADKLLAAYREKLKNYQDYSVELKQYLKQQQNAGGDFGPGDFGPGPGDEGPGPGPGPGDEGPGPGPGPAGPESAPTPGPTDKGAQEKKINEQFSNPKFEQGTRSPGSITVPQPQNGPAPIQASTQRSMFGSLAWDGRAAMPVLYQRY